MRGEPGGEMRAEGVLAGRVLLPSLQGKDSVRWIGTWKGGGLDPGFRRGGPTVGSECREVFQVLLLR